MNALILTTTLVIQLYNGQSIVRDGLTQQACEEVKCAYVRSMSCAEAKEADAKLEALLKTYSNSINFESSAVSIPNGNIKYPDTVLMAKCVP